MKKIVYLVEDNPAQARLLKFFFDRQDFETEVYSNFSDAEIRVNKTNLPLPVIAVIDIQIQGGSGIDLLKIIKKSAWKEVPCVILSASSESGKIRESLDNGASDYILKPVDPEIFFERIKDLIIKI